MFCGEDFKMATSEVEDIAALVGIEIVTDGTCKAVSEEPEQQPPHTPDRPTIAQPGIGECEGKEDGKRSGHGHQQLHRHSVGWVRSGSRVSCKVT